MQAPQETITSDDIVAANPELVTKKISGFLLSIPIILDIPPLKIVTETHLFFVSTSEPLGKGSFAAAYTTYPIDAQSKRINFSQTFATKIVNKKADFQPEEYKLFSNYYYALPPREIGNKVYLVTELFPGYDLFDDNQQLNAPFRNLDFGTTLEVIQQLCSAVNSVHHETPSTGSAVVHNDIKGGNIKLHIAKDRKINVYLFDFGLADRIEHDPNAIINTPTTKGTAYYAAPESLKKIYSIKGDIWALVPIIAALLGAIHPLALRDNPDLDISEVIEEKYDLTGLFLKFRQNLALMGYPFHEVAGRFINRMQEFDYKARPDSDELLKFFIAFNLAYKIATEKKLKVEEAKNLTLTTDERQKIVQESIQLSADLKTQYCTMLLVSMRAWQPKYTRIIENIPFQNNLIRAIHSYSFTAETLQNFVNEANAFEDTTLATKNKLKNYRGRYPAQFLEKISNLAECEPYQAEKFLVQLEKLVGQKKKIFETILTFETTFKSNIDINTFVDSIAENPKHTIDLIAQCTVAFLEQKKADRKEEAGSFKLLAFLNYSDAEILESSEKLLAITQGSHKELTPKDVDVLRSTPLGAVLNVTNGFEAIAMMDPTIQSKKP